VYHGCRQQHLSFTLGHAIWIDEQHFAATWELVITGIGSCAKQCSKSSELHACPSVFHHMRHARDNAGGHKLATRSYLLSDVHRCTTCLANA
jgi:hypothetical protein